jgi:Ni/Co efflux regulator RcnB
MARPDSQKRYPLTLIIVAVLAASPAMADKPSWAGGGKGDNREQHERHNYRTEDRKDYELKDHRDADYQGRDHRGGDYGNRNYEDRQYHDRDRSSYSGGRFFIDRHRTVIHDYYHDQYRSGHCPPGLAKKHNGCMPPGQAKKWGIGKPLTRDVVFYDLPPTVVMNIGYPRPGYRFVRVASDILMIAIGTGIVMDAIYDLGGGRW